MYGTYLRRELAGRKRQTMIVAIGLAIAIALVIIVNALTAGVRDAQAQALESVYGVGTDLTVTGAAAEPGEGGGQRFDQLESRHVHHLDIADQAYAGVDQRGVEEGLAARKAVRLEIHRIEQRRDRPAHGLVVVDDAQRSSTVDDPDIRACGCSAHAEL